MEETNEPLPEVRAAGREDLGELVRLLRDHAAYERVVFEPAGKVEALDALLFSDPPRLHGLVAAVARGLVGYATWAVEVTTMDAMLYAHVDGLYVDEAERGRGTGRRLLERVVRDARAAGCREVQWQTPAWNERAIAFYERATPVRADKVRFFLDEDGMTRFLGG